MSIVRTFRSLVEMMGFEPMTPCLQGRCSPSWATPPKLLGICLSPSSYLKVSGRTTRFKRCLCTSDFCAYALVGPSGLEPPTSCLSGTRSNLLSYDPMWLVWFLVHTCFLQSREQISLLSLCVGIELSSRAASSQVFSPLQSLTSVFGMGTGGPSAFVALTSPQ